MALKDVLFLDDRVHALLIPAPAFSRPVRPSASPHKVGREPHSVLKASGAALLERRKATRKQRVSEAATEKD